MIYKGTQNTNPEHWPRSNAPGVLLKKKPSKKVRKQKLINSANHKQKQNNCEQSEK